MSTGIGGSTNRFWTEGSRGWPVIIVREEPVSPVFGCFASWLTGILSSSRWCFICHICVRLYTTYVCTYTLHMCAHICHICVRIYATYVCAYMPHTCAHIRYIHIHHICVCIYATNDLVCAMLHVHCICHLILIYVGLFTKYITCVCMCIPHSASHNMPTTTTSRHRGPTKKAVNLPKLRPAFKKTARSQRHAQVVGSPCPLIFYFKLNYFSGQSNQ